MTVRRAVLAVVATAVAASPVRPRELPQLPTFRAGVAVVSVDVAVRRGRVPVAGLTKDEFELLDNGVPQQIELMSVEAMPIDVSLALDTSDSIVANFGAFKDEVRRFARELRREDRLRLVAFGYGVREVLPMAPVPDRLDLDSLTPGGATSANDGIFYALLWPAADDRRHLVIALTDGVDTSSMMDSASVVDVATRARAVLHVILVEGRPPTTTREQGSRDALIEAAKKSGGASHALSRASSDFKRIFDDFRASYVLRYTPKGVARDGWHDLRVTLKRPDAATHTVRARRGYWGATR